MSLVYVAVYITSLANDMRWTIGHLHPALHYPHNGIARIAILRVSTLLERSYWLTPRLDSSDNLVRICCVVPTRMPNVVTKKLEQAREKKV